VRDLVDDRPLAVVHPGGAAVTVIDPTGRALLNWIEDASELPWWERAAPLRPALHWALRGPRSHLVHAGAVGDQVRGGVLLAGRSGAGKTTVAVAALQGGMRYVADDYLLLTMDAVPTAWNLYRWAKLDEPQKERFAGLAAAARHFPPREPDQKWVLDISDASPGALIESLPVRAVVVPRVGGLRVRLRRIGSAEAFLALAPSSALQMPFDDGAVVRSLAAVVRTVPCFALDVAEPVPDLAAAVDHVLDEAVETLSR
jgi:hypothetical protein